MPEKTKEKKTFDISAEEVKGGAAVFIPKKRNKKIRYPKGYDPANPGQLPDPERWLPKWQRSRFKKMAKKKGIYLKGAQGDAQLTTNVQDQLKSSTAHVEASTGPSTKRRKK